MQAVKVSWVGQTFALARCNDSQGKKPRIRKTKEERRTLVESFIKNASRYRNSNNGNFPSLNLTHKEVGGSFYTIREIVRDIIQENKVLRPGSLTSQALNFVDCSEQHSSEPFSLDHPCHLSLMTTEHATDEGQAFVFSNEHINKELITTSWEQPNIEGHEAIKFVSQEAFALHADDILVPQIMDRDSAEYQEQTYNGRYGNGDTTNEKYKEDEPIEPSEKGQNNSQTQSDEKLYIEVPKNCAEDHEMYRTEDPVGFPQTLSITSTLDISIAKDIGHDMQGNNTSVVINSSVERDNVSKIAVADIPETRPMMNTKTSNISDQMENQSSSTHTGEVFPMQSIGSMACGSDQRSVEIEGFMGVSEVLETNVFANEEEVSSLLAYSDPAINKENSVENLSSAIIEERAATSIKTPIFDVTDCPPSDISKLEVQPLFSSNDVRIEKVDAASEGASGEPTSFEVKSELKNCSSSDKGKNSTLDGTNSESSDKAKMETPEANQLWAVVKGFITAFIKFWTE